MHHQLAAIAAFLIFFVAIEWLIHIERRIKEVSANQDKIDAAAAAITAAADAIKGAIEPINFDGLDAAVSDLQAIVPAPAADPTPSV